MRSISAANPKPFTQLLLLLTLFTLALTAQQARTQGSVPAGYRFVQFDAPGSGTVQYAGTEAVSINSRGATTGYVIDSGYGAHGFLRNPNRTFTVFDAPGADPVVGGTFPLSINDRGVIAGVAIDTHAVIHGFPAQSGRHFHHL